MTREQMIANLAWNLLGLVVLVAAIRALVRQQ